MKFKIYINIFKIIFKLNLFKTIYFNYKVLPFKQFLKLPIHFYGRTQFKALEGKFVIDSPIHFGMIAFGGDHEIVISSQQPTRLLIKGEVVFKGYAKFGKGVNIVVLKYGKIVFGKDFSLGSNSNIISFKKIIFGDKNLISWNCDIYDTDFHFMEELGTNIIKNNCANVIFGNSVWIGSRCVFLKNTILPNYCIVGSKSLCTGNYSKKYEENIIIAGNPAKLIKSNFVYIDDKQKERLLVNKYKIY